MSEAPRPPSPAAALPRPARRRRQAAAAGRAQPWRGRVLCRRFLQAPARLYPASRHRVTRTDERYPCRHPSARNVSLHQ
eukprot:356036-Chlamydomonas_euryale.AAC.11